MFTESITYPAAFLAGLLSFFSPCILPLIPAYFSFITGYSLGELTDSPRAETRRRVISATVSFILGFSFIFILFGASASALGGLIFRYKDIIRIVGGGLIILFGIHLSGLYRIRLLEYEKRIQLRRRPFHLFGNFTIGMAFAAGWSPCIGPLLGSILVVAGTRETVREGMALLGAYSAGIALPFLIVSFFIDVILTRVKKSAGLLRYLNPAAGALLIFIGMLVAFDRLVL
jgi:cytochrome c-type biogenesis protein